MPSQKDMFEAEYSMGVRGRLVDADGVPGTDWARPTNRNGVTADFSWKVERSFEAVGAELALDEFRLQVKLWHTQVVVPGDECRLTLEVA